MKLIFHWVGKKIPKYGLLNLQHSLNTLKCDIVLLTNIDEGQFTGLINQGLEYENITFDEHMWASSDFFWKITTLRFQHIYNFMQNKGLSQCFHSELDNINFYLPEGDDLLRYSLIVPRDSEKRAIASLIYFDKLGLEMILSLAQEGKYKNDMELLGNLPFGTNGVASFPTEKYSYKDYPDFVAQINSLTFDAASIGQFLLGVDPSNRLGPVFNMFQNTNSALGAFPQFSIVEENLCLEGRRLANVHCHSKNVQAILDKKRLCKLISRINMNKPVLMGVGINVKKLKESIYDLYKVFIR